MRRWFFGSPVKKSRTLVRKKSHRLALSSGPSIAKLCQLRMCLFLSRACVQVARHHAKAQQMRLLLRQQRCPQRFVSAMPLSKHRTQSDTPPSVLRVAHPHAIGDATAQYPTCSRAPSKRQLVGEPLPRKKKRWVCLG